MKAEKKKQSKRLMIRLTEDELNIVELEAAAIGLPAATFIRSIVVQYLNRADKVPKHRPRWM